MKRFSQLFSTALVSLLLTSCGGGGGSQVAEGGIGGTGVSAGRVTGFGSVFVNGIEYETDASTDFSINGASGSESDLAVGMVVRLTGSKDEATSSGNAESIDYSSLVTGPVDIAYNATNDTFSAMGQLISVNADTVYEGSAARATVDTLILGDIVEVSGFSDGSSGTILATRIEFKSTAPSTFEVVGTVSNIISNTFMIGTLTINAGSEPIPAEGTLVEVESSQAPVGLTFNAESISTFGNGDGTVGDDGEEVEIEGQVTVNFDSASNRFTLNGQVVEVDLATIEFKDGATTADLVVGRIIEVEGTMSGDILLAEEIEAEAAESSREEMAGSVTAVVVGSGGSGSITLLGQTVLVTSSTILKSDLGTEESFNLTELQAAVQDFVDTNDYVEVNVFRDGNGDLVASKIERDEPPYVNYGQLEGFASFDGVTLSVLGVAIDYSGTGYSPTDGQRIEAVGEFFGSTLFADSISIAN